MFRLKKDQWISPMSWNGITQRKNYRYTLASMPREMVMNTAVDASHFDFVWVPEQPENVDPRPASSAQLPKVQFGAVKSPLWEGTPHARVDLPGVPQDADASPRDYSRSYPDRCVFLFRASPVIVTSLHRLTYRYTGRHIASIREINFTDSSFHRTNPRKRGNTVMHRQSSRRNVGNGVGDDKQSMDILLYSLLDRSW